MYKKSDILIYSSKLLLAIFGFFVISNIRTTFFYKNDEQIELARYLSRLVSGLYEAQFDHWRCRVYGPSEMRKEIAKVSETVLGI